MHIAQQQCYHIIHQKMGIVEKKMQKKEKDLSAHPTTTMEQDQIHQLEPRRAWHHILFLLLFKAAKKQR